MGHPWGVINEIGAANEAAAKARGTRVPLLARLDSASARGFLNLLLAITMTYVVAFGFVVILAFATSVVNTQYLPAAQQNPFASGVLLAGAVIGAVWWMAQRRRA